MSPAPATEQPSPLEAACRKLANDHAVGAISVCYLFSFRNPAHEIRTREIIAEECPRLRVSLSSEVDPAFREYERRCVDAGLDEPAQPDNAAGGRRLPRR